MRDRRTKIYPIYIGKKNLSLTAAQQFEAQMILANKLRFIPARLIARRLAKRINTINQISRERGKNVFKNVLEPPIYI